MEVSSAQLTTFLEQVFKLKRGHEEPGEIPNSRNPINLALWNQWAVQKTVSERRIERRGYRLGTKDYITSPIIKLIKGTSTPWSTPPLTPLSTLSKLFVRQLTASEFSSSSSLCVDMPKYFMVGCLSSIN